MLGVRHEANNLRTSVKNIIIEKINNGPCLNSSGERPRKRFKDYHFYSATWNVLSLHRAGMLKKDKTELKNFELILQQFKR